ncbi:hypothetical protein Patl1_24298 [Pistacia atlantica]|uniref:Uncharacterized protein n=1 Tax=Pistacia atlantica TaxID=434234 RepID=A0ACC1A130_9ROSI|nr:hypothetical protein Patl1_24298 [Pistacia atlantica]
MTMMKKQQKKKKKKRQAAGATITRKENDEWMTEHEMFKTLRTAAAEALEETSNKEDAPFVFLDCASRATIGKRMTKLLGHEIEEDELFWIKDAPNNKNDIAVNKRTAYNERGWSVFGSASLKEAFKNLSQMKKQQMMQKKVKRKKEGEEKRMTQEEMLLEAAQTEIMNLRNLERVSVREEEVKK